MKIILVTLGALLSISASAGQAKLTWSFDNRTVSGQPVTVSQFRIYYGMQGQPLSTIINLGPPAPLPWRVVNGIATYSKTYDRPEWTPNSTWCFQMTALANSEESAPSNMICRTFPEDPNAPVLIDIVTP